LLINKKIWCPRAKTLNDPFEFHFHLRDKTIAGIQINQASLEEASKSIKELGVICLSEINNDILMWSHYSNGHTGFCIEFERSENNDLGKWEFCLPVAYDSINVPSFDPERITERGAIAEIVSRKAPNWSYEKEWRLIISHEFANGFIFLPAKITAIIFGCKMDYAKRHAIANILRGDVTYFEAIQMKDSFCLDIKPLVF